ncbi:MAG: NAD-dependent epimerase/dehydratase family protein [Lachnospiraceae bacterium]|nr:NAD-dependent epimerase/dehydratase family protein [Lachnospiraceae bacterium]
MGSFTDNKTVQSDINEVLNEYGINWQEFKGKTWAITGATGLIGRLLVATLVAANKEYKLDMKVAAFVRNESKANAMFDEFIRDKEESGLEIVVQDITEPVSGDVPQADYIIHTASVTASKQMVEQPVETILTAIEGTKNVLEYAARKATTKVVYLSSMEVYGSVEGKTESVKEEDLGYIEVLNVRSGYPEGKRLCECLCASYAKEKGVHVKIVRLSATFGAGIDDNENRVFAQFARSTLKGEDIVLHTTGEKANCYCYTTDAIAGIIAVLLSGEDAQAYNICNMDTFCSIKEMAEVFASETKYGKTGVVIDIPEDVSKLGYAPASVLKLNSEKAMSLGWTPKVDMKEMSRRLMESLE